MALREFLFALLLPLPPWVGFWIFRRKGRVGLSFGYFLGGILAVLALPWPKLTGQPIPSAQMGGALFGFTLFLQAHREGKQGVRRLAMGVGGASIFVAAFLQHMKLSLSSLPLFWATAVAQGLLWLLLSDLGYRITHGAFLQVRVPLVGTLALGIGALIHHVLPAAMRVEAPRLTWPAALVAGFLLGLVALEQLKWMRKKGTWVEGRGEALRGALSILDKDDRPEGPSLSVTMDTEQGMALVDEKGRIMETNGALSRLVGLPRHQLRGYMLEGLAQGDVLPVWEHLRQQLLQQGYALSHGTLASAEGSYLLAQFEAVAYDRGMALVWVARTEASGLCVRALGKRNVLSEGEGSSRILANALGSILPAVEQILAETKEPRTREAAERILLGAHRAGATHQAVRDEAELEAGATLEAMLPRLQKMVPAEFQVHCKTGPMVLRTAPEPLQKMVTHLVLNARQAMRRGILTVAVEPVQLGGRPWALLSMEMEGDMVPKAQDSVGFGWLQEAVRDGRGMLELSEDPEGRIWPTIFLPVARGQVIVDPAPLKDRMVWIVDQDALVRGALGNLVVDHGGEFEAFADLREMLHLSRLGVVPDLLVLERSPQLERFQRALRNFQREAIPTLVLGSGEALSLSPTGLGLRKVGFLEKPFPSQDFVQSLLALLEHD